MDADRDMTTGEAISAVATAHTRTVDALAGFEKMVEEAEPGFRPVAERFRDLHERHAAALSDMLARAGAEPDADGSFMAVVNRAVVATRAFLDEIDDDVMDSVRSGEKNVLSALDDAARAPIPATDRASIAAMRSELAALIAEIRHID